MNALQRDLKSLTYLVEEQNYKKVLQDPYALSFHLMPKVGWLNDPNGLCQYKGEYHVFFQYSPFAAEGGVKFWGHYTSVDFINWEYKGTELFADQPYDCHGVYSGSAFIEDGKMYLYYTGNVKKIGDYDYVHEGREHNTILLVSEDGKTFKNKKLIMTNRDYTEEMTCHVRDPKVWKEEEMYYMVQGARDKKDVGQVLVFSSKDKENWKLINKIKSTKKFGFMWECPDFFKLEGEELLLLSPQGVESDGLKYHNIYQSGYYKIKGDITSQNYELSEFEELDRGFDFYAPQTFSDSKNRRILIGWMGLPDIEGLYSNPTLEYGWQHALTLPRVLSIKEGKLIQTPIEELQALRSNKRNFEVEDKLTLEAYETFEMQLQVENLQGDLEIKLKEGATLCFDSEKKVLTLSFDESGYGRDKRAVKLEKLEEIHIFCDTSSLEIFVNKGSEVFTSRFYPKKGELGVSIQGDHLSGHLNLWEMKAMTIEDKTVK